MAQNKAGDEIVRTKPGYHIAKDDRNLTTRQREVMGLLAQGMNTADIGRELDITRSRASAIIKTLVDAGWVIRNGRALAVVVTREGVTS
jgi:DNA-binding NarL/FixJ family response regulator